MTKPDSEPDLEPDSEPDELDWSVQNEAITFLVFQIDSNSIDWPIRERPLRISLKHSYSVLKNYLCCTSEVVKAIIVISIDPEILHVINEYDFTING